MSPDDDGLYIVLISVHGLIRGTDPELGRDVDTGGQVAYVLDLARMLSDHPDVSRVDLLTRQILSTALDDEYAQHLEQIADRAWIVRLPFGPHRYLHKETLWPYLPQFVDHALQHFRELGRIPDVVHSHYADAGSVGLRLARLLGRPLVHTGHSLGRVKKQRLLDRGLDADTIEKRYNITRRIAAEESVIEGADLVITSTKQERDEQYAIYDARARGRMAVIPPGVDLSRFRPPRRGERFPVRELIDGFLVNPRRPMILAVQRPDERKNLETLIHAYGSSDELRRAANLVLLIGSRDDISELPAGQRRVLTDMLLLIDRYDLYGAVAYPKRHGPDQVPEIYRLAAGRRGVFVNPALTEPFGLTLIEAAASGLPIVATNDGGPRNIVEVCENGLLIDPLDGEGMADALLEVLSDGDEWRRMSRSGIRGANATFSWKAHVQRYLRQVRRVRQRRARVRAATPPARMVLADRLLICDVDDTLLGDREATVEFLRWLSEHREELAFGVASGRVLRSTLEVLQEWEVPLPDLLITAVGTEIHYGRGEPVEDVGWRLALDHAWEPPRLREAMQDLPGIEPQPDEDQRPYKISYFFDSDRWPGIREVRRTIREHGLSANVIVSHDAFLDLVPVRASGGHAVSYVLRRWGFSPSRVLAAGDSGNDSDMLRTAGAGVVVGNFSREMRTLRGREGIYFARAPRARGILEGIRHFDFLGR